MFSSFFRDRRTFWQGNLEREIYAASIGYRPKNEMLISATGIYESNEAGYVNHEIGLVFLKFHWMELYLQRFSQHQKHLNEFVKSGKSREFLLRMRDEKKDPLDYLLLELDINYNQSKETALVTKKSTPSFFDHMRGYVSLEERMQFMRRVINCREQLYNLNKLSCMEQLKLFGEMKRIEKEYRSINDADIQKLVPKILIKGQFSQTSMEYLVEHFQNSVRELIEFMDIRHIVYKQYPYNGVSMKKMSPLAKGYKGYAPNDNGRLLDSYTELLDQFIRLYRDYKVISAALVKATENPNGEYYTHFKDLRSKLVELIYQLDDDNNNLPQSMVRYKQAESASQFLADVSTHAEVIFDKVFKQIFKEFGHQFSDWLDGMEEGWDKRELQEDFAKFQEKLDEFQKVEPMRPAFGIDIDDVYSPEFTMTEKHPVVQALKIFGLMDKTTLDSLDQESLKKRYFALAKSNHSDRTGTEEANAMQEINAARKVLIEWLNSGKPEMAVILSHLAKHPENDPDNNNSKSDNHILFQIPDDDEVADDVKEEKSNASTIGNSYLNKFKRSNVKKTEATKKPSNIDDIDLDEDVERGNRPSGSK